MISAEADLSFLDGLELSDHEHQTLTERADNWPINDKDFDDYGVRANLPGVTKSIRERLSVLDSNVALDIAGGSNAMALQQLMREGLVDKALVTNYSDRRSKRTKSLTNLEHIDGDILNPEVWHDILTWQQMEAPEGFSLVMHRPGGALQKFSLDTYCAAANLLLSRIRPGGMLFTQIPVGARIEFDFNDRADGLARRDDIEEVSRSFGWGSLLVMKAREL